MSKDHVSIKSLASFLTAPPYLAVLLLIALSNAGALMLLCYDQPIPPEAYRPLENTLVLRSVLSVVTLNALCLACILVLSRVLLGKFFSLFGWLILIIFCASLVATTQYYVYFGGYPSYQVISEFLANPLVTSGYASSAIGWYDYSMLLMILLALVLPIGIVVWDVKRVQKPLIALLLMVVLLAGVYKLTRLQLQKTTNSIPMGMASQHMSLPIKFWTELLAHNRDNTIELASNYLPPIKPRAETLTFEKPRNIIVFVIDCARADHLPFYGYERNTLPNLYQQKDDWIVFSQFYAHGPTTSVSIPVLLNSHYSAGIHRQGLNARFFWDSLQDAGFRTAYINSATLKWGHIEGLAGVELLDFYFTADHDQDDRVVISDTAYDFNIRDAKLIAKYREYLAQSDDHNTMAFVHLNATHFPYHSEDGFNTFRPYLDPGEVSAGREQIASTTSTQKILNSYDNSLVYVDHLMQEYIELLRARGQLEDSVIFVTADHGEAFREHGYLFHNTGIFNELVKIPLLARVGSRLPKIKEQILGQRNYVGGLVDILPTVASLAGAKRTKSYQGRSILFDQPKPYELIFYRFLVEEFAVVSGHRKFIYSLNSRQAFLFDLAHDPQETRNLWVKPVANFQTFLNVLSNKGIVHHK